MVESLFLLAANLYRSDKRPILFKIKYINNSLQIIKRSFIKEKQLKSPISTVLVIIENSFGGIS
jgi:hypothetical protein